MKSNSTTLVIGIIVALALGFFGGMQYQKMQRGAQFAGAQAGMMGGQGGFGGQRRTGGNGANRPVMGEIISKDDKSITVKLPDGSSKIVVLTDKTAINKAASATTGDLQQGVRVGVFGTTNTDGSVTAINIQLNPQMRGGAGMGNTTPTPSK